MKYSAQQLLDLMDAGNEVLDDPDNTSRRYTFLAKLNAVERDEADQLAREGDARFRPPAVSARTNAADIPRPVVQRDTRSRLTPFFLGTVAGLILAGMCFLTTSSGILPQFLARFTEATATATVSLTTSPTATPTPSLTATSTLSPTASATITPTNSLTASPTVTPTWSPTATSLVSPTAFLTNTPRQAAALAFPVLTAGDTTGVLSDARIGTRYQFEASAGDTIEISVFAEGFDPYLLLLDANGSELASDDDCGSLRRACIEALALPSAGVYTVVLESFDRRTTGTFTLSLTLDEVVIDPVSTADSTACPSASVFVVITTEQAQINLRSGPGASFGIVGFVYDGECFAVIGRNENDTWFQIRTGSGRTGWLSSVVTQFHGDPAALPIRTG